MLIQCNFMYTFNCDNVMGGKIHKQFADTGGRAV